MRNAYPVKMALTSLSVALFGFCSPIQSALAEVPILESPESLVGFYIQDVPSHLPSQAAKSGKNMRFKLSSSLKRVFPTLEVTDEEEEADEDAPPLGKLVSQEFENFTQGTECPKSGTPLWSDEDFLKSKRFTWAVAILPSQLESFDGKPAEDAGMFVVRVALKLSDETGGKACVVNFVPDDLMREQRYSVTSFNSAFYGRTRFKLPDPSRLDQKTQTIADYGVYLTNAGNGWLRLIDDSVFFRGHVAEVREHKARPDQEKKRLNGAVVGTVTDPLDAKYWPLPESEAETYVGTYVQTVPHSAASSLSVSRLTRASADAEFEKALALPDCKSMSGYSVTPPVPGGEDETEKWHLINSHNVSGTAWMIRIDTTEKQGETEGPFYRMRGVLRVDLEVNQANDDEKAERKLKACVFKFVPRTMDRENSYSGEEFMDRFLARDSFKLFDPLKTDELVFDPDYQLYATALDPSNIQIFDPNLNMLRFLNRLLNDGVKAGVEQADAKAAKKKDKWWYKLLHKEKKTQ